MVSITVELRSNRLAAIAAGMMPKARALVGKTVFDVEAQAKTRAPVDTGALRNSIHGTMTGATEGEVTTGVEYAVYQEYGTVYQSGQPFMRPAAEAVRPAFEAGARQIVAGL